MGPVGGIVVPGIVGSIGGACTRCVSHTRGNISGAVPIGPPAVPGKSSGARSAIAVPATTGKADAGAVRAGGNAGRGATETTSSTTITGTRVGFAEGDSGCGTEYLRCLRLLRDEGLIMRVPTRFS